MLWVLCSSSAFAHEYLVGIGLSSPFHSKRGHVTKDRGVSIDLTQYLYENRGESWGYRIGVHEVLWSFPSVGGLAGGIGPAGELFYQTHPYTYFLMASGSGGAWNLAGKFPETNGTRMFSGQVGVGVEYHSMRVEIRYQHLSNGNETRNNAGLDMITPMISWRF